MSSSFRENDKGVANNDAMLVLEESGSDDQNHTITRSSRANVPENRIFSEAILVPILKSIPSNTITVRDIKQEKKRFKSVGKMQARMRNVPSVPPLPYHREESSRSINLASSQRHLENIIAKRTMRKPSATPSRKSSMASEK